MRASIIIAAHNEGQSLWKTVRSCIESIGKLDHEILIADDASDDQSLEETLRRFPHLSVHRHDERQGASPTKHSGASNARGEVLVFLDGHCNPQRGAIERLVEDVERLEGQSIVTPTILALDTTRWKNKQWQVGHGYRLELDTFDCGWLPLASMRKVRLAGRQFYESPAAIGCALAVHRELYDDLRGFDPHMRIWGVEDLDFGLKCWLMGHSILHDPKCRIGHRFRQKFDNFEVPVERLLVNKLRMAYKNFTHGVRSEWVDCCRQSHSGGLPDHPEGLWAYAWKLFEMERASAEQERAYLMARRPRDEFWYSDRFNLPWPQLSTERFRAAPAALEAIGQVSPSPPPCSVDILTPDGTFVGTGRDQRTIILEADVDPPLSGATYSWSAVTGPGGGTFNPTDAQSTEFQGTTKGKVTVKVVADEGSASCEDTQDLVVIEINDLSEDVPDRYMNSIFLEDSNNQHTVLYGSPGDELRAVLIAPTYDPSDPYVWDVDFQAQVDHLTGDVNLAFYKDGVYLIKTIRTSNGGETEELFPIWYNAGDGTEKDGDCKDGKWVKTTKPTADLILVSSSANDDTGYLRRARNAYANEHAIGSVDEVITEMKNYFESAENNSQPFSLLIVDLELSRECQWAMETTKFCMATSTIRTRPKRTATSSKRPCAITRLRHAYSRPVTLPRTNKDEISYKAWLTTETARSSHPTRRSITNQIRNAGWSWMVNGSPRATRRHNLRTRLKER